MRGGTRGGALRGLAVNTPNVLSFTLGSELGEIVGSAVMDGSGEEHLGITYIPIPVLTAAELGHHGIFAAAAWRINRRRSWHHDRHPLSEANRRRSRSSR